MAHSVAKVVGLQIGMVDVQYIHKLFCDQKTLC